MRKLSSFLLFFCLSLGIHAQHIIENPEKPLSENAGRVLQLKEEMRISDEQGGFYFKSPQKIKIAPDGSIFVLDEEQFLKFDDQGKFVKNLFRKGQGPGEFMRIENYIFCDNEIIIHQSRPDKIVKVDIEGNLINEFRLGKSISKLITCFKDEFVMANHSFPKLKKAGEEPEIIDINWNILFVSEDGKIKETDHYFPAKWFAKRIRTAIIANYIVDFSAIPYKKKYLTIFHTQNYLIKLFDLEENQIIRIFNRKYKRVEYKHEKKAIEETRPSVYTLGLPTDYHNDIQKLFLHKDNLWVLTSTIDMKKGNLVDAFNMDGQYINNFYLPLPKSIKLKDLNHHPITISEDFLFIVEHDENDVPVIVKYRIMNLD